MIGAMHASTRCANPSLPAFPEGSHNSIVLLGLVAQNSMALASEALLVEKACKRLASR